MLSQVEESPFEKFTVEVYIQTAGQEIVCVPHCMVTCLNAMYRPLNDIFPNDSICTIKHHIQTENS